MFTKNKINTSKLWFRFGSNKHYYPTSLELIRIFNLINTNHGGILKKGTYIPYQYSGGIVCAYDVVIIKEHVCVLLNFLGEGAFGKVFKAFDMTTSKLVAVKSQPMENRDIIMKQVAVTKTTGIGLYDINCTLGPSFLVDRNGYFILPLADTTFDVWIVQKSIAGRYDLIINGLIKIAKDIQKLHESGKVHLDIKMDNILVVDDITYLADFGKVESIGSFLSIANSDYREYPHCAPEYFSNVTYNKIYIVDHKFDIFSFGFMLHESAQCIKYKKLSMELKNISTYNHRFTPNNRQSLETSIKYLKSLK